jgi:hypothetical protein
VYLQKRKKDQQRGKQLSGHQAFTGSITATPERTYPLAVVIAAPSPEVAKPNDQFVKTMKPAENKGSNNEKVIT